MRTSSLLLLLGCQGPVAKVVGSTGAEESPTATRSVQIGADTVALESRELRLDLALGASLSAWSVWSGAAPLDADGRAQVEVAQQGVTLVAIRADDHALVHVLVPAGPGLLSDEIRVDGTRVVASKLYRESPLFRAEPQYSAVMLAWFARDPEVVRAGGALTDALAGDPEALLHPDAALASAFATARDALAKDVRDFAASQGLADPFVTTTGADAGAVGVNRGVTETDCPDWFGWESPGGELDYVSVTATAWEGAELDLSLQNEVSRWVWASREDTFIGLVPPRTLAVPGVAEFTVDLALFFWGSMIGEVVLFVNGEEPTDPWTELVSFLEGEVWSEGTLDVTSADLSEDPTQSVTLHGLGCAEGCPSVDDADSERWMVAAILTLATEFVLPLVNVVLGLAEGTPSLSQQCVSDIEDFVITSQEVIIALMDMWEAWSAGDLARVAETSKVIASAILYEDALLQCLGVPDIATVDGLTDALVSALGDLIDESFLAGVDTTIDLGNVMLGYFQLVGAIESTVAVGRYSVDLSCTLPQDEPWVQVTAGGDFSCALRSNGAAACWGNVDDEWADWLDGASFVDIDASPSGFCGAVVDGGIQCWADWVPVPGVVSYSPGTRFVTVSVGYEADQLCAIDESGAVECSGIDEAPEGGPTVEIAVGSGHACSIEVEGPMHCWGEWSGDDAIFSPFSEYRAMEHSSSWMCLLKDEEPNCLAGWPDWLPTGEIVTWSLAEEHGCVIRPDGSAACFGDDSAGQASPPDGGFVDIAAGGQHTCAVTEAGEVVCWGDDGLGQSTPPG